MTQEARQGAARGCRAAQSRGTRTCCTSPDSNWRISATIRQNLRARSDLGERRPGGDQAAEIDQPVEAGNGPMEVPRPVIQPIAPLLALPARPILDVDQVIAGPSAPPASENPTSERVRLHRDEGPSQRNAAVVGLDLNQIFRTSRTGQATSVSRLQPP
jgi:hypothetical protein